MDASIGLTGCHPRSLAMRHAAVTGIDIGGSWGAAAVPILETLARVMTPARTRACGRSR